MEPGDAARKVERLPGVLAASLFVDGPGGPLLYLATTSDTDLNALAEAARAILDDCGYRVVPERIHVGRAPVKATPSWLPRLTLESLDVRRSENRVECTVRVRTDNRITGGTCVEPDTPGGRGRAAARAALRAAQSLDPDFSFGVDGVLTVELSGRETVVVLVDAMAGRAQAHLPGAALLDRSVEEAAALAALRALRAWRG